MVFTDGFVILVILEESLVYLDFYLLTTEPLWDNLWE